MHVFSVTQFLSYVNETFRAVWDAQDACVEGEVSGFRISQGQWVNFDVKDESALISVFMVAQKLQVPLQDGMRVRLYGVPRVYPKYGKFSFNADRVELVGEGALRKALAMLREKLAAEGLFEPSRKRPLSRFPSRICLIASRESAGYGDFIRIVSERWGGLEIDLYHVLVQGENAPMQIVAAIEQANAVARGEQPVRPYDALVLTRGGGSFEELMAFNDERVVRALYASKIPTLVGIGHERDLTLAEEVADVRGSTPTDCARRLVPDRRETLYAIATQQERITDRLKDMLAEREERIRQAMTSADHWLERVRVLQEHVFTRVIERAEAWLSGLVLRTESFDRLFTSLDPRSVMRRGYAVIRDASGRVVVSSKMMKPGDDLRVELRDGEASAVVKSVLQSLL